MTFRLIIFAILAISWGPFALASSCEDEVSQLRILSKSLGPGLDDPAYIENLTSYRPKERSLAFDIERSVHTEKNTIEYSMMLTASYQAGANDGGPSRLEFIDIASKMEGFELRHSDPTRVLFVNRQSHIFVNWLNIDGKVTIGAISLSLVPSLVPVLEAQVPAAVQAFARIWPDAIPPQQIIEQSIAGARSANINVPVQ